MRKIILDKGGTNELTVHDSNSDIDFIVGNRSIRGLESATRRITSFNRSGQNGQTISTNFFGGRLITWEQVIIGEDNSDYLSNRLLLLKALSFERDSNGKAIKKTVEFTLDDGTAYTATYVARQPKLPHKNVNFARGFVILECEKEGLEKSESDTSIYLSTGGGFDIPFSISFDISATTGGSAIVQNNGDIDSYPTITLHGALVNPTISNQTTGKSLHLTGLSTSGSDVVTIDMRARTIKLDNQNYFAYKTSASDFWTLEPGSNTILFTDTTFNSGTHATVSFASNYSGV